MKPTTALFGAALFSITLAACDEAQSPQGDPGKSSAAPARTPSASVAPPANTAVPVNPSPQLQLAADMELSSKVKNVLQEPARSHVEVAAADGVVTLYGTVEAPAEKERVALLAMGVDGVRSVVNNLIVLRGS